MQKESLSFRKTLSGKTAFLKSGSREREPGSTRFVASIPVVKRDRQILFRRDRPQPSAWRNYEGESRCIRACVDDASGIGCCELAHSACAGDAPAAKEIDALSCASRAT